MLQRKLARIILLSDSTVFCLGLTQNCLSGVTFFLSYLKCCLRQSALLEHHA